MKWSWRLATVAGIGIYVHVTFFLLVLWVAAIYYLRRHSWMDACAGIVFIIVLFAIVVLHELGHALTAKRFGIQTRDITLLPIGGVARLERIPTDPKQELIIALAGPAVNVVLAAIFFAILVFIYPSQNMELAANAPFQAGNFLLRLMWINIVLAGFNLLPAFPMDGGRVLRALLALKMNYLRATAIAAAVGKAMALVFGFVGLFTNPFLIIIALFVWMGAEVEGGMAQMRTGLGGVPISRVMITEFKTLKPGDPLAHAVDFLLSGYQHDFPVVDDGKILGLLTRKALVRGLAQNGQAVPVSQIMERDFVTAQPSELAETAMMRLQDSDCRSMLVLRDGELSGIVTSENLGEYLMVQAAMHGGMPNPKRL